MANGRQLALGFRAGAFLRLALPMIVSRAGLAVMGIADGIMVARYRSVEFAWLSLAEGTLGRLLDIFVAFLIGGLLLCARHYAMGDEEGARLIWRRTLPASLGLGFAGVFLGFFGKSILGAMGQSPALADGAAPIMAILGAGFPAALLAISAAVYLESIQQPKLVALCVIVANLLNLAFNWLLIGGHFGIAAMGARGSALSTTLVRYALAVVLAGFAWHRRGESSVDDATRSERVDSFRSQWRLSFGAAAGAATMIVLSSSLILFAGRLGVLPLAAFSAAWALAAPAALVTLGMADAAGIRVAAEDGRGSLRSASSAAWSSLRLAVAAIVLVSLALVFAANTFAGLYAKDAFMRQSIADVIPLVALILIVDCIGFVIASSLRAIREAAWPAAIEIGAMIFLVPVAANLSFWRGLGIRGLFLAMLAAGSLRAGMLAARFYWRTRPGGLGSGSPDETLESLCQKI